MKKAIKHMFLLSLMLISGCRESPPDMTYDDYILQGTVYWGNDTAINAPVEMTRWAKEDTMSSATDTDTTITNSSGKYSFKNTCSAWDAHIMPFKVRAKDSTNNWSAFQYDSISPKETVTIDFHL